MNRLKNLIFPLVALAAGAVTPFAFAPFRFWIVSILSLAVFISLILYTPRPSTAFYTGLAYGFGSYVTGVYWLYISMHDYGNLNPVLAGAAVVLLALFMGLLPGSAAGLTRFFMKGWKAGPAVTACLIFPAFWVLSEWIRGWLFTGFPWVVTGYAHTTGPFAGYASVAGVYGISFITAIVAGAVAFFFTIGRDHWKRSLALTVTVVVVLTGVGAGLRYVPWTTPHGEPIQVRLLQGNVPQEFKFTPIQIQSALTMYADLITRQRADLIVTPETAIPVYLHQLPPDYLASLARYAARSTSRVVLGMPLADSPSVYTNSLAVISPDDGAAPGLFSYRYNKHHLVPFGEFVPTGFGWFVKLMRIPLGDFTRGDPLQKPFPVKDQWVLPNICYEDLFGEEIADQIKHEHDSGNPTPTLLLNVSNIAWFGNTIALPQHLQISQMRSLETGRPMLRATNTGATAVIDEKGNILARLSPYTQGEIGMTIQGRRGATPYIRFGNLPVLIAALVFLAIGRIYSRRRQER